MTSEVLILSTHLLLLLHIQVIVDGEICQQSILPTQADPETLLGDPNIFLSYTSVLMTN